MDVKAYTYDIVKTFKTTYEYVANEMQISHNDASTGIYSDWHLEGSVYTHTMMVLSHMQGLVDQLPERKKELLIAALLHDVGKIGVRELVEEKQKFTFYGHANMSTFFATTMIQALDPTLTDEQKVFILRVINYHQIFFQLTDELSDKGYNRFKEKFNTTAGFELIKALKILRTADFAGRIARFDDGTNTQRLKQLCVELGALEPSLPVRDKNAPTAVIMVGVPCSGKSTYAAKYYPTYTNISRDAQVMKHAEEGMTYSEAWKVADHAEVDIRCAAELSATIVLRYDLVIDKTNLTHKSRKNLVTRLTNAGYNTLLVVLLPSPQEVDKRTTARTEKCIPVHVVDNMILSFQMPFEDEGEVKYVFS